MSKKKNEIPSLKLAAKAPENRPKLPQTERIVSQSHPFSGANLLLVSGSVTYSNTSPTPSPTWIEYFSLILRTKTHVEVTICITNSPTFARQQTRVCRQFFCKRVTTVTSVALRSLLGFLQRSDGLENFIGDFLRTLLLSSISF